MNRFMKDNNRKYNILYNKKAHGFNLIELFAGMAITSIIAALASQALIQTQNSFGKDQKKVANNQKTSSILEIVGREIRQAGELITDQGFPVIQVKPLTGAPGGPVSLIIYRAITDPLPICQAYPTGAPTTGLLFAVNTTTNIPCRVLSTDTESTSTSLKIRADWIDKRTVGGTVMAGNLLGVVGSQRTFQPFVYTSDPAPVAGANSLNLMAGTNSFTPAAAINLNDSAYLVIKKEYLICGTNLMVRINSTVESSMNSPACSAINTATDPTGLLDIVATNIAELNINMITREKPTSDVPNPPQDTSYDSLPDDSGNGNNRAFPTTFPTVPPITRDWQNIQGVIVNIVSVDPLPLNGNGQRSPASFSSQGTFYPRNVLSTK
jgi:type II secretory pathway pseudopilin PulG